MLEFQYWVIRSQSCLFAFPTHDADTYISHLNHTNIISTVSNTQNIFPCVIFNSLGYDCFLGRGHPAANDSGCLCWYGVEIFRGLGKGNSQGNTIDDEDSIGFIGIFIEFIFQGVDLAAFLDDKLFLVRGLQTCSFGNADCGFDLVPCYHPDIDTCISQLGYTQLNIFLQFIFNSSDTQKLHIVFQRFNYFWYCCLPIYHWCTCFIVLFLPLWVFLLW